MLSRFYFHLVRGNQRIPDRRGLELDPPAVMSQAIYRVVKDIWPGTADPGDWEGWSVEILDAEGRVVRVIALV